MSNLLASTARVLAFCLLGNFSAFCQITEPASADTATMWTIQTTDGNEFYGKRLSENDSILILQTQTLGVLRIQKSNIQSIRRGLGPKIVNGRLWFPNRFAEQYFASFSGYGLQKGDASYSNAWVLFNHFSYGLTDHFSIGAGGAPIFWFEGPLMYWVTPKLSLPLKENVLNVGLGAFFGQRFGDYESGERMFSFYHSQITYGPPDANVSVGVGFGLAAGRWSENLIFSLAGAVRVGPRFSLVGENYYLQDGSDTYLLLAKGMRILTRFAAFDVGVITPALLDDGVYPLPWVGLHVPMRFGKK